MTTTGEPTRRRHGRPQPPLLAKPDREAVWEFRRVLRREGYADATIRNYLGIARRAAVYLEVHRARTIRTATDRDLLAFFDEGLPRSGRGMRRLARKALIGMYEALGREETRNPAHVLPVLPEPKRKPRPLTRDDYTAFLAAAVELGGFHEAMGVLYATTGCRFDEIRRLRWDRVRLGQDASIEVVGKGSGRRGPAHRDVPLHPLAEAALRRWRVHQSAAPREEVFPPFSRETRDGFVSEDAIRNAFKDIVRRALIEEHVTPHRLRHSVATFAVDATRDLRAVQELLGHGSLATTELYVGLIDGRTREAVASLPVVTPGPGA